MNIQPLQKIVFDDDVSKGFKLQARYSAELDWIKKLQTPFPLGLNDNIYQAGNISKNSNIDIFSILSLRKRKRRSHGIRKNHNLKRKLRKTVSIQDLNTLYIRSGIHALLCTVTNLPLKSLVILDNEADKIYLRTHPLYEVASIIQKYTTHALKPHIDKQSQHKRHFMKIKYINKGIDFIDLPSIFRDKNIINKIPSYFENKENPMICYKYKKPIRSLIFNYNQTVADLNLNDPSQDSCNCSTSPFCYLPSGHIITGDLNIIDDYKLRNLLFKGPKYRLPDEIDFDLCCKEIADAVNLFADRWCKRENTDTLALNTWKKAIFKIIKNRVKFYGSHPSSLPKKPFYHLKHLKQSFQNIHDKFVLVPADKASNNIIFV